MSFIDVIARKRDGHALAREQIDRFVQGVTDGSLPDYQIAALLMAIVLRGMDPQETTWLTDAMVRSGERVDLSSLPGVKVGKHSTGGVGDKLSLVLVPLVASCGVTVPKMSGRGLGHTGGTLDKLESIPGFRVQATAGEFTDLLRRAGAAIVGQTGTLAPADRRLYAIRDVTATVESVPLIAASIMSKKLAEGSNALLLDVKCGRGAFMPSDTAARELATALVRIGRDAGLRTEAVITSMDAPLGRAVGNAVEVVESIEVLKGHGPRDLRDLATTLGARALVLSGQFAAAAAAAAVERALATGAALDRFERIVTAQGGDARVLEAYDRLPGAATRVTVAAERSGYLALLDAARIGRASALLGAGRTRMGDTIDHGAGILILRTPGEPVDAGDPILELAYNDGRHAAAAEGLARAAIGITDAAPELPPLVRAVITASDVA